MRGEALSQRARGGDQEPHQARGGGELAQRLGGRSAVGDDILAGEAVGADQHGNLVADGGSGG